MGTTGDASPMFIEGDDFSHLVATACVLVPVSGTPSDPQELELWRDEVEAGLRQRLSEYIDAHGPPADEASLARLGYAVHAAFSEPASQRELARERFASRRGVFIVSAAVVTSEPHADKGEKA